MAGRKKEREKPIGPRLLPAAIAPRHEPHGPIVTWTCAFCGYATGTYESDAPIGWTMFGGEPRCRRCSRCRREKIVKPRPKRKPGGLTR